ncbi:tRNA (adenosine(37)-N6)-threonylcarbamoyltransferase complex dimerization subunit type 1 TsaB [Tateyamaria omphalii]|uniref:tRNA (adenosine(37)-N6)-threonylcarbamoyltransferase complex dimerization subunit type 1 TsaB n=1 Tax=Tateyamaria omphalii TaxID=299262 RepID=UPI001C995CB0|nr:tRNA (adenosine(37)-N6)-threonylcarbamoyltransferase complex dimerization subunit type 1 TsaB [Tateyamaria omphalii]MBY5933886.1 tRNA (adenosine(37)-N6)-threonylcarbamoyltransferase complex dimerization subunit type 1 TsaB [Tateyamaria omphalii]
MTSPLILGFDTSAAHCAAALVRGDDILASVGEEMARGQAERLMSLLEEVLKDQGVTWADLDALAVGTGPGNFTGIRIGVSAARGLALGLECPAYGVTGFDARDMLAPSGMTVAIPAPREMVYVMHHTGPELVPAADVTDPAPHPAPAELAVAIARCAVRHWPDRPTAPAPFYIRAPDAAPARDAPPAILP